jgi:hypothetical protein
MVLSLLKALMNSLMKFVEIVAERKRVFATLKTYLEMSIFTWISLSLESSSKNLKITD